MCCGGLLLRNRDNSQSLQNICPRMLVTLEIWVIFMLFKGHGRPVACIGHDDGRRAERAAQVNNTWAKGKLRMEVVVMRRHTAPAQVSGDEGINF